MVKLSKEWKDNANGEIVMEFRCTQQEADYLHTLEEVYEKSLSEIFNDGLYYNVAENGLMDPAK